MSLVGLADIAAEQWGCRGAGDDQATSRSETPRPPHWRRPPRVRFDPSIAVTLANRAVMAAEPLRSGRIRGYLRELHTATRPHARLSISRLTQVPA
jgi:hypothetical protein